MKYCIEDINKMSFDNDHFPNLWQEDKEQASYRLTSAQISRLPDSNDTDALRRRLAELYEKHLGSGAKLEAACDIKRDTFQRILRFRNGRNIQYQTLAKFCVGVGLSVNTAKELFALTGHTLTERNRTDFILLCALENGSDLSEYAEDMEKYCGKSILSEPDKPSARSYDDTL